MPCSNVLRYAKSTKSERVRKRHKTEWRCSQRMALKRPMMLPPPKNRIMVETRIVKKGEKARKVKTLNGKIQEIFNGEKKEWEKYDPNAPVQPSETKPLEKIEQEPKDEQSLITETVNGLQLIPKEDIQYSGSEVQKQEEVINTDTIIPSESPKQEEIINTDTVIPSESPEQQTATYVPEIEPVIPKIDLSKVESLKIDTPKEILDIGLSKVEPLKIETPKEILDVGLSKIEPLEIETPKEILDTEPPKVDTPKVYVPKVGTPKVYTPKVYTPKVGTSKVDMPKEVQKEVPEMPIPGVQDKMIGRLSKIMEEKTSPQINIEPPKAKILNEISKAETFKEIPKVEAPKVMRKEKQPIKEVRHFMAEEQMVQPNEDRKFEEWLKRHKFQENVEKMTDLAAENQKEIEGISTKIVDVKEEIGGVKGEIGGVKEEIGSVKGGLQGLEDRLEERLGPMKKPVSESLGEICTGVDCIKGDIKKSQDTQQMLESKMNQRFEQLSERLQSLEEPTFVCDNCGHDGIRPLSSFCSNCGSPIHEWNDENGHPIKGWAPFWKRGGNTSR